MKRAKALEFRTFLQALEPYHQIALTAPEGADGDSVGTQCALFELLKSVFPKKRIRVINEDPCPYRYKFLKYTETFELAADVVKENVSEWPEVLICVDGGHERIGHHMMNLWRQAKLVSQVDHHVSSECEPYSIRLYDAGAAATTVIIYELIKNLNIPMTKSMAQAIYTGLIFDTGLFKHSNTTPETMLIAADLLKTGFNHTETAERVLLIRSKAALHLLQIVLNRAVFDCSDKYVWSKIHYGDFEKLGASRDEREGMIDFLFQTRHCEVAALYYESAHNTWKMSFRSRKVNVAELAASLNPLGGGHIRAAGCPMQGDEPHVLSLCHAAVKKVLSC